MRSIIGTFLLAQASLWSNQAAADLPEGRPVISGYLNGRRIESRDLRGASRSGALPGEVLWTFRHRLVPVEIEVAVARAPGTHVVSQRITARNTGSSPVRLRVSSVAWDLPAGDYDLTYLHGGWGRELQLATERIGPGARVIGSGDRGRSSNGFSPWFCLRNTDLGVRYAAQLAYSGNWEARFEKAGGGVPLSQQAVRVEMRAVFDNDGDVSIAPNGSFLFPPAAFIESRGELDDLTNELHRYQRTIIPRTSANEPPLVQFNSWYPYGERVDVATLKETAAAAAKLGAEAFVLDSGWYVSRNWEREVGNYRADAEKFPHGLGELGAYVRSKGMKFGIWTEIENAGIDSQVFREHPEWCLARDGQPVIQANRCQLNFARSEVREWARGVVDRLVREAGIEWIKIDYNIDIGNEFDGPAGDTLYRHLASYYGWLDEIRRAYPNLIVENCSSGGLRFDLGIIGHTHTTWLSDRVLPIPSVQLGYGCTVAFAPEICNHWMVGDRETGEVTSTEPGWWDFMFRVAMNGQFGISSRILDWSPALRMRATENIALYKRVRRTIAGSDVYHLTSAPGHDYPTGWAVIQYVSPSAGTSVVMGYRLRAAAPQQTVRPRGLDRAARYRIVRDGVATMTRSGADLMDEGITLTLDGDWRSTVLQLTPES